MTHALLHARLARHCCPRVCRGPARRQPRSIPCHASQRKGGNRFDAYEMDLMGDMAGEPDSFEGVFDDIAAPPAAPKAPAKPKQEPSPGWDEDMPQRAPPRPRYTQQQEGYPPRGQQGYGAPQQGFGGGRGGYEQRDDGFGGRRQGGYQPGFGGRSGGQRGGYGAGSSFDEGDGGRRPDFRGGRGPSRGGYGNRGSMGSRDFDDFEDVDQGSYTPRQNTNRGGWQDRGEQQGRQQGGGPGDLRRVDTGMRYSGGGGRGGSSRPMPAGNMAAMAEKRRVSDAITAATTYAEIQQAMLSNVEVLDSFHVATMMNKLVSMLESPEGRQLAPEKLTEAMNNPEFVTLLSNCYGLILQFAPTFKCHDISTCMYAMGKMGTFNQEVVMALAGRCQQVWSELDSTDLTNIIYCFGRMGATPGAEWIAQYQQHSIGRLRSMRANQMVVIINSLKTLGVQLTQEWALAFSEAAANSVSVFRTTDLIDVLSNLAVMGGAIPRPVLESCCARLAMDMQTERTRQLFSPTYMSTLAQLLAAMEFKPSEQFVMAYCQRLAYVSIRCTPSELSTIAYSFAYLGLPLPISVAEQLLKEVSIKLPLFKPADIANLALALGTQGIKPKDRLLDEIVISIRNRLRAGQFQADSLTKLAQALPMLGTGVRLNEVVMEINSVLSQAAQAQQAAAERQAADLAAIEALRAQEAQQAQQAQQAASAEAAQQAQQAAYAAQVAQAAEAAAQQAAEQYRQQVMAQQATEQYGQQATAQQAREQQAQQAQQAQQGQQLTAEQQQYEQQQQYAAQQQQYAEQQYAQQQQGAQPQYAEQQYTEQQYAEQQRQYAEQQAQYEQYLAQKAAYDQYLAEQAAYEQYMAQQAALANGNGQQTAQQPQATSSV